MKRSKRSKSDFRSKEQPESWYDMQEDWPLIEASFFKQYGIRLRSVHDMPYSEFCSYLSGLMPDTPLGNIVKIRSEDDKEVLKHFTPEQKRIRSEWQRRNVKKVSQDEMKQILEGFKDMFRSMAKGGA